MAKTIDMQLMRYINLFERVSRVSTTDCFVYNNAIYFAVPKKLVYQAVGRNGDNVKNISMTLRRKIKVVAIPSKEAFDSETSDAKKIEELRNFIKDIVSPVEITAVDFKDGAITISGSRESKAILIGRDRCREKELAEVLQRNFGIKVFKIL